MTKRGGGGGYFVVVLIIAITLVAAGAFLYDEARYRLGLMDSCEEYYRELDLREGVIRENETLATQLEYGLIEQGEYEAGLQPVPDEPTLPEGC